MGNSLRHHCWPRKYFGRYLAGQLLFPDCLLPFSILVVVRLCSSRSACGKSAFGCEYKCTPVLFIRSGHLGQESEYCRKNKGIGAEISWSTKLPRCILSPIKELAEILFLPLACKITFLTGDGSAERPRGRHRYLTCSSDDTVDTSCAWDMSATENPLAFELVLSLCADDGLSPWGFDGL